LPKILIIGYGSRLRTDDGVGPEAAELLAEFYRDDPRLWVISAHQLTPEMARDAAEAEFLLLLDADAEGVPGTITTSVVSARPEEGSFTHACTPAALLSAAKILYGHTPAAVSLTLSAASFDLGTELSPAIRRRMSQFIAAAQAILAKWLPEAVGVASQRSMSCSDARPIQGDSL